MEPKRKAQKVKEEKQKNDLLKMPKILAHFRRKLWNQPPGPKGSTIGKVKIITGCPSTESGESASAQSVPVPAVYICL